MAPKIFVVLVVMHLHEVAVGELSGLPCEEVTEGRSIDAAIDAAVRRVGLIRNLGSVKLVDVVQADDGTVVIGYRVRTRSHWLTKGFTWLSLGAHIDEPTERYLVDRAWELEQP